MKRIEAIIRPEKLNGVKGALEEKGFMGMTIDEVKGRGRQKGIVLQWRAGDYRVDLLPKVRLELIVADEKTEEVISIFLDSGSTGKVGDGKIFISPVEEVIRVRTGERGEKAI